MWGGRGKSRNEDKWRGWWSGDGGDRARNQRVILTCEEDRLGDRKPGGNSREEKKDFIEGMKKTKKIENKEGSYLEPMRDSGDRSIEKIGGTRNTKLVSETTRERGLYPAMVNLGVVEARGRYRSSSIRSRSNRRSSSSNRRNIISNRSRSRSNRRSSSIYNRRSSSIYNRRSRNRSNRSRSRSNRSWRKSNRSRSNRSRSKNNRSKIISNKSRSRSGTSRSRSNYGWRNRRRSRSKISKSKHQEVLTSNIERRVTGHGIEWAQNENTNYRSRNRELEEGNKVKPEKVTAKTDRVTIGGCRTDGKVARERKSGSNEVSSGWSSSYDGEEFDGDVFDLATTKSTSTLDEDQRAHKFFRKLEERQLKSIRSTISQPGSEAVTYPVVEEPGALVPPPVKQQKIVEKEFTGLLRESFEEQEVLGENIAGLADGKVTSAVEIVPDISPDVQEKEEHIAHIAAEIRR